MMRSHSHAARTLRRPAILAGLCLSLGAAACAEHDPTAPETADAPTVSRARPAAAANVRATPRDGGVLVAWTDASSNETGFRVFRSVNGGAFEEVNVGEANTESYGDHTVAPGQTYRYGIAPFNAAGEAPQAHTGELQLP